VASGNGDAQLSCVRHEDATPVVIADGVSADSPLVGDENALYVIKAGAIVAIEWPSGKSSTAFTLPGETPPAMALTPSELLFVEPSVPAVRALVRQGNAVRDVLVGPQAFATSMLAANGYVAWSHPGEPFKGGDEAVVVAPTAGGTPRTLCQGDVALVAIDDTNAYCRHGEQLISVPLSEGEARSTPAAGALLQRGSTGSWAWYSARWDAKTSAWVSTDAGGYAIRVGERPGDPDATVVVRGLADAWRFAVAERTAYVIEPNQMTRWRFGPNK
jgi:hypothetical protein